MTKFFILILVLTGFAIQAQTNAVVSQEEIGLRAEHFRYDGATRQLIYSGNVRATNAQGALSCERLTIRLPADSTLGSHPTNAVAETNVVIIFVNKGDTNHLTCDKAIYDYNVTGNVTNETFTFTGHATNVSDKVWMTGEPLIWDNASGQFSGTDFEAHIKQSATSGNSSNAAPFHILK